MTTAIYLYKMSVDCGGAPCVHRGLLSLAICKPQIRARAEKGALIFGFGANEPPMRNRLIYVAKVSESPVLKGAYYKEYSARPDCIYQWRKDNSLTWKRGSLFHKKGSEAETDIGVHPNYSKATVLLSRDFRYFGGQGTIDYALRFPLIAKTIQSQGRYYLVHHAAELRRDLLKLKAQLWRDFNQMKIGSPTTQIATAPCNASVGPVCTC